MTNLNDQLDNIERYYRDPGKLGQPRPVFDPYETSEFEFETDQHPTPESRKARESEGWELCWKYQDTGAHRYARKIERKQSGGH